ncbi:peptidase M23 [Clostridiaceae bacterium 14S0207]|nr:peptidase M23 [Clostridiaceae bacterium 14S0207]
MELIKENIEYEQLLGENCADTVLRDEYVIPDTHPDVGEILMLDARPRVTSVQVLQDKVFVEGVVDYNLMYLNKNEGVSEVHGVNYSTAFTNNIDCRGALSDMNCDAECFVEHMECSIVNERKVCIEGIIKLKTEIYNKRGYEIVKDVEGSDDIQFWKEPIQVDKVIENISTDLMAESHMKVPMEKPQIDKVMKWNVNLHKKDVKLLEGKLKIEAWANIKILYKAPENNRDIYSIEDDVLVQKEVSVEKIKEGMNNYTFYEILDLDYVTKEDDLGENRLMDIVLMCKANTTIMNKEEIQIIEDAYSPSMLLDMEKQKYDMNIIQNQVCVEKVIRGDIEVDMEMPSPREIILCKSTLNVTDKKIVEDRVVIEGVMDVTVLYRSNEEQTPIYCIQDQIPFSSPVDMPGTKIHMQAVSKISLEDVAADIQAGNISVKAVAKVYVRVNYIESKEFLINIGESEGELPKKKASIIIYVVQKGDTLWKIAKRYNTTIENIVKVNNIEEPEKLKEGTKLIIPGRAII